MTLPALIQKNNNTVVETRLKKFYSVINQAILMAEKDYGDKKFWYNDLKGAEIDNDGNPVQGSSESEKWFNKYFLPYLKVLKTETLSTGDYVVYLNDGGAISFSNNNTRDWRYFPGNPGKCLSKYGAYPWSNSAGICSFVFNFVPNNTSAAWKYHYNKGFEPYKYNWDGVADSLETDGSYGCNNSANKYYCTAVIQMNGWKIPYNYPYKVSY